MNEWLAFFIGLLVGASGGAAAMRVVRAPLARLEALERRVDELLRRRDGSG